MFCVLGVVLQTILDVYNCFTCIVSLYRSDPTPRKIDRWLVFQTLYIYIYIYIYIYDICELWHLIWTQYWERVNSLISKFPKSHGTVKYTLNAHVSLFLSWLGDSYLFVLTPCSLFILQKIELIYKGQHFRQLTKILKLLFRVCIFHLLSVLLRSTSLVSSNSSYMYFNTSSKRVLI